jgi:hypothetical protein
LQRSSRILKVLDRGLLAGEGDVIAGSQFGGQPTRQRRPAFQEGLDVGPGRVRMRLTPGGE